MFNLDINSTPSPGLKRDKYRCGKSDHLTTKSSKCPLKNKTLVRRNLTPRLDLGISDISPPRTQNHSIIIITPTNNTVLSYLAIPISPNPTNSLNQNIPKTINDITKCKCGASDHKKTSNKKCILNPKKTFVVHNLIQPNNFYI